MPPAKKQMNKIISEEEKILQMERQKIADKEAAKKKELMLCEYLKIKSVKENKAMNFNLKYVDLHNRYRMRREKTEDLKKESFILFQTFERILDLKNMTISNLLKSIDEAKIQYETSVASHMENVDHVIDFQRHVLYNGNVKFNQECNKLFEQFDKECREIEDKNKKNLSDLADIFFSLRTSYEEKKNNVDINLQNQIDEIKNKSLEDKHSLKAQLDVIGDNLWKEFRQTYENYNKSTEDRRKLFEELSAKDVNNSSEIAQQRKKLQNLTESINSAKIKLSKMQRENDETNSKLRQEKDKTNKIFYSMKSDMNKLRLLEQDRLNQVVVKSTSALKALEAKLTEGKKLLALAEQCRKMETEEEKILPFYECSIKPEEVEESEKEAYSEFLSPFKSVLENEGQEMVWKRYNKVALDVICLQDKQKKLINENLNLKNILKQYLDGLSVNQGVMENDNSLLVVNGKTNVLFTENGIDDSKALQVLKLFENN